MGAPRGLSVLETFQLRGTQRSPWSVRPEEYQQWRNRLVFRVLTWFLLVIPTIMQLVHIVATGKMGPQFGAACFMVGTAAINYISYHFHKNLKFAAIVAYSIILGCLLYIVYHSDGMKAPHIVSVVGATHMSRQATGARHQVLISTLVCILLAFVGHLGDDGNTVRYFYTIFAIIALTYLMMAIESERDELAARHDDLFAIAEGSTDFIALQKNQEIIYMNPALIKATGLDPETETVGIHQLYPERLEDNSFTEYSAPTTEHWSGESTIILATDEELPVLQTVTPHDNLGTGRAHASTIMKDISQLKRQATALAAAKEEAEIALAARQQFLANMSHEIRTPLNGVLGMAQLLETQVTSEKGKNYLETLTTSGQHLLDVISDILDVSKLQSRRMSLERQPFCPAQVIRSAQKTFSNMAERTSNRLHLTIEGPDVWIEGDSERYKQVVVNLVSNALKFTSKGDVSLSLTCSETDEAAEIYTSVKDTGIGIPANKIDRIFKAFEQEDNSNSRRFGGTGLGLAISSRLVTLFGGTLSVESKVGAGSLFFFSFSAARALPAFTESLPVSDGEPSFDLPSRVVVAEDNIVNRKVIHGLLSRIGIAPMFVTNGLELIQHLQEAPPYEVILMDCHMPEMDGFQATEHIVATIPREERPRIIAVTASTMKEERERCFRCGMDDFISKPVHLSDLREALHRAMFAVLQTTSTLSRF